MCGDINQLRKKIDTIDEQILQFLRERVRICELIGSAKKAMCLPIHDAKREEDVFKKIQENAVARCAIVVSVVSPERWLMTVSRPLV